jgi:pyruvate kinase
VGPSSFGSELQLLRSGATAIRFNASHLAPEEVVAHCERIMHIAPEATCVVDLQGAKMRLGRIAPVEVRGGDRLRLSCSKEERSALYVPHPELFEQIEDGETIVIDDGRLHARVVEKHAGVLIIEVARDYVVRPRKGINRADHPVKLADLGEDDRNTIAACCHLPHVHYAVSFVVDGSEALWVQKRAEAARVTLKIERQEAIDNLQGLAEAADELWICRGDLGAQLGLSHLGRAISSIEPRQLRCPVFMAGQVFEHLTNHDEPTRSEVCHLHDLLQRGYAGIVLSDETAIGRDPIGATQWAKRLLDARD